MLITDSVTVAVEVPIYLTPKDITHMQRELGFYMPLETNSTLTGHIDVLQVRNGRAGSFSFPFCPLALARERVGVRVVHRPRTPPHPDPLPHTGAREVPSAGELNSPAAVSISLTISRGKQGEAHHAAYGLCISTFATHRP
jgi:hypothetical protein